MTEPDPAAPHCASCTCGRRAPVQEDRHLKRGLGTVSWAEHLEAWGNYVSAYGRSRSQSAESLAQRGGFGYGELIDLLRREPLTWRPASQ